jgi:hypothetical protein
MILGGLTAFVNFPASVAIGSAAALLCLIWIALRHKAIRDSVEVAFSPVPR